MRDWAFWLLIGLAIFPMLIPVQRRYQVVRLRTAARMPGLQNAVPARLSFKETRSPYLTLREMKALHQRRGNRRLSFVLTITILISVPLLAVFTGIVYYRIAIDSFNPPYYAIWVRPGEVRHRVEFIISPWHDFLMTIDGEVAFKI